MTMVLEIDLIEELIEVPVGMQKIPSLYLLRETLEGRLNEWPKGMHLFLTHTHTQSEFN